MHVYACVHAYIFVFIYVPWELPRFSREEAHLSPAHFLLLSTFYKGFLYTDNNGQSMKSINDHMFNCHTHAQCSRRKSNMHSVKKVKMNRVIP